MAVRGGSADGPAASPEWSAARRLRGSGPSHGISQTHTGDGANADEATSDLLDVCTDLALLRVHVDRAVAAATRTHHLVALAVMSIDDIEDVTGGSGPDAEAVLRQVHMRLSARMRRDDSVMRIGHDQFAVLWRELDTQDQAEHMAAQLRVTFDEPFSAGTAQVPVTASIGVSILGTVPAGDELVDAAVMAMHEARGVGSGQQRIFIPAAREEAGARIRTGAQVLEAVQRQEFVLHYQPVVDLVSGRVVGVEALVRWQHPTDGLLAPDLFIPVAEGTGSVVALGRWVLESACAQAAAWHAQGLLLNMAVNLSALQLADPDLVDTVARILATTGLSPRMLTFEVTESAMIADAEIAVVVLNALAALGASLSIDDFGTGYSSLVYLKRYPIRALKIDRAFVSGMGVNQEDDAIVASVVSLARAVRGTCVAEGIETEEQLAALRALGCRYGQGWLFGKGVPADELPALSARCERELIVRLEAMPPPGDRRDVTGVRRDLAAGERDHTADVRDHEGDTRDAASDQRDRVGAERDVAANLRDRAADVRDDLGAFRDQVASRRDRGGQQRDLEGELRDNAAGHRDVAADARDVTGARRDEAGDQRHEEADRRDEAGALRDRAGEERDDSADERDMAAQRRDQAADSRDEAAEARDEEDQRTDPSADRRSSRMARQEAASDRRLAAQDRRAGSVERTHAVGDRTSARSDRSLASQDRRAGAEDRTRGERDRTAAVEDRDAGSQERADAEQDRSTAQADRGSGAWERTEAEQDRDAALLDRSAGADEREHAEQDRDAALLDRAAGAAERDNAKQDRTTAHSDRDAGANERAMAEQDRESATADRVAGALERSRGGAPTPTR